MARKYPMKEYIHQSGSKNRLLAKLVPGLDGIRVGPLIIGVENFYYHVTKENFRHVSTHSHNWYEFSQPMYGHIDYIFEKKHVTANNTTTILIPPGVVHEWRAVETPILIASFLLQIRSVDSCGKKLIETLLEMLAAKNYHFKRTTFAKSLEMMLWDSINRSQTERLLREKIHTLLRLYIVNFFNEHLSSLFPLPEFEDLNNNSRSENEMLVDQIISYVGLNLRNSLRLEDLATHFHFSPRHLNRVFKEQTGQAIGSYVLMRRLQESCDRLINTNQPVKRIAYELGFKDSSYFCRFFRGEIGYTPNQYRTHKHGTDAKDTKD